MSRAPRAREPGPDFRLKSPAQLARVSRLKRYWKSLLVFLALAALAALTSVAAQPGAWYASLNKPSYTPPDWLFTPMWIAIYAMMAVAAWRVWTRGGDRAFWLLLWFVLLVLSAAWSPLIFGLHHVSAAAVVACFMVILANGFVTVLYRVDRVALWLMVPSLAWAVLLTLLTASLLRFNAG